MERREQTERRILQEDHFSADAVPAGPDSLHTQPEGKDLSEVVERWKEEIVTSFLGSEAAGSGSAGILAGAGPERVDAGATQVPSPRRLSGDDPAWAGLAAVALGRFDLAGRALAHMLPPEELEATAPGSSPLVLLLAAWTALWSGSPNRVPGLERWVERGLHEGTTVPEPVLAFALRELADALEPLGRREASAALRKIVRRGSPRSPFLPPGPFAWPAASRDGGDGTGEPRSRPQGTTARIKSPSEAVKDRTLEAARGMTSLAFGVLGARADAFFGRLRLAPEIPSTWGDLHVRRLCVGDASLSLDYHREEGSYSLLLRPTGGRVPLNVVFEPRFPSREIGAVLLDGAEAEVDRFPWTGGRGIRLQLPVDRDRRLVVHATH